MTKDRQIVAMLLNRERKALKELKEARSRKTQWDSELSVLYTRYLEIRELAAKAKEILKN